MIIADQNLNAQNTPPYWSLAGNSNATTSSIIGTTNGVPLRLFTNGSERIRINTTGKVGLGMNNPGFPLNFSSSFGDKISLSGNSGAHYGFGVQSNLLQIHTNGLAADIAFGYGSSSALTELMRIKGNGNIGIGTNNPSAPFEISKSSAASYSPHIFINEPTSNVCALKFENQTGSGLNDYWLMNFNSKAYFGEQGVGFGIMGIQHSDNLSEIFQMYNTGAAKLSDGDNSWPPSPDNSKLILSHNSNAPTLSGEHANLYWDQPHLKLIESGDDYARITLTNNSFSTNDSNFWAIHAYNNSTPSNELFNIFNWRHGGNLFTISGNHRVGINSPGPSSTLTVSGNEATTHGKDACIQLTNTAPGGKNWYIRAGATGTGTPKGGISIADDNFYRFAIDSNGNVGIGTLTPNSAYKLTITGSGLAMGGIWQNSDLKLKKNINDFSRAMDMILQLKPKTYFFKTDEYTSLNLPDRKQYGFVAQDLEKVIPEIVQTSKQAVSMNGNGALKIEEIKSVNYTALIPLLTKAIQEQQQQIEKQQQQIDELKQMVKSISKGQDESVYTDLATAKNNKAALEQNTPNPSNSSTSIRYSIPITAKNAQLIIRNNFGETVKQVEIQQLGTGVATIDVSALNSSVYSYSLVIDGRIIETKKMLVAR